MRESLFSALESADLIAEAAVLDLYAGSGALGLEAVSRGAVSADLVEKAPRAASVAERNARAIGRADGVLARLTGIRRPLTLRIDTAIEVDYYRHGGILQYVLRQMVKS